jgi:hypothetical protein
MKKINKMSLVKIKRNSIIAALFFCLTIFNTQKLDAQILMSATGSNTETFDALISTGTSTWSDNSTIPNWFSQRTTPGVILNTGTGSSNTGGLYSFGSTGATERALGTVGSGNANNGGGFAHGVQLKNTSGSNISDIKVSYTLEQWRNGGTINVQPLNVYFKISSSAIAALNPPDTFTVPPVDINAINGWTPIPALSLSTPINVLGGGLLDGNLAANKVSVSNIAIPGLNLANNEFIMIKWDDSNHVTSDHGIGIDDVTISWTVSAVSPTLSASTLTTFGNVCTGSNGGPNSFTITGAGLSSTSISVGPLTGYSFSTSASGPFLNTLSIPQNGGTYLSTIYVQFSPTLALPYNGDITVSGGGATAVTVAASGTGLTTTTPTFNAIAPICSGDALTLPTTSTNSITGTWSPAVNNTATTTYTFTPTGAGCATTASLTVTVNPRTVPTFNQVPAICSGGSFTLPTTSTNAVTGTWSPAINNTATTTYTFTPTAGLCATTATMTVSVNSPGVSPIVRPDTTICSGGVVAFPTTSINNISGTWSPAFNNNATTTYTFTPTSGQCAIAATRTVTVTPTVTTQFATIAAICSGGSFTLPTTSSNGITGTWSPAINNTATTTYTFTPNANQCATTATLTVTVNPSVTPTFAPIASICVGGSFTLPTSSTNGVTGTWSPAINNNATTTYTFTPTGNPCALTTTLTVTVNTPVTPTFTQVAAICSGSTFTLPTSSTNGFTGTWAPAINNNVTTTYTFTPNNNQCAGTATMTVQVSPSVVPAFVQVAPICSGQSFTLPTTSTNGVSGTWAPAVNNTATTTYTFTPAGSNCATTTTMTVVVLPSLAIVETADSTNITANSAVLHGVIAVEGCSAITEYGVEYSGINGFIPGFGTKVISNNLLNNSYSSVLNGLIQNTAYYYRAYAKNATGIVYGAQKLFITKAIPAGLIVYDIPAQRGTEIRYSLSGIKPGRYALRIFNSVGQLVYQKDMNIQINFIDDRFVFPAKLPIGNYTLEVFNPFFKIHKAIMVQ